MTFADVLGKWFGTTGPALIAAFIRFKALAPDLGALIDNVVAKLGQAATIENLMAFAGFILAEGQNVAQLKFKGEQHPGDLV